MRRWFSMFSGDASLKYRYLSRYADGDQKRFQDLLEKVEAHIALQRKKIVPSMDLDQLRRIDAKIAILEKATRVLREGSGLIHLQNEFAKAKSAPENLLKPDSILWRKSTTTVLVEEVIQYVSEKEKTVQPTLTTPLLR